MLLFSFSAIVMNIGADIAGMGAMGNLFPSIYANYFSVVFTIILLGLIIYLPYQKIASVLKLYLCIVMLVYFIVPFLYKVWRHHKQENDRYI